MISTEIIISPDGLRLVMGEVSSAANSGFFDIIARSIIAPAIVAVLFTGFTNFFLERLKVRRQAVTDLCDSLRSELSDLQDVNTHYWSQPHQVSDAISEAKIMAALEATSTGLRTFEKKLGLKLSDDLDGWLVDLRDKSTGGGFQSVSRDRDFGRLQSVASQLSRMRYRIFEERLKRM